MRTIAAAVVVATFLIFITCKVAIAVKHYEELTSMAHHNFLVGIANIAARYENHSRCGQEIDQWLQAIVKREFWSLKVLDTFGVAPKTFSWGNYFWFAAPQLCEDLNNPFRISMRKSAQTNSTFDVFNVTSPIPLAFTVIYMNFSSPHYIDLRLPYEYVIHIGLCLPASCAAEALQRYTDFYFQIGIFETQRTFALQLQSIDARTPAFRWSFFRQTGTIIFGFILAIVILLTILAEVVQRSKMKLKIQQKLHTKTTTTTTGAAAATNIRVPPTTTEMPNLKHQDSLCEELILCFHLAENYKRAMRLENCTKGKATNANFLGVIAGMRSIICLWVTIFHVYYYCLFAMTNAPLIFAKLENFILQPVMQACFYVDVFFVISAFLLVNNFLSNDEQIQQIKQGKWRGNLKEFGKIVLQRYLRLTPVLIITILLSDMVYDFLNMYSPFRLGVHSGIYCKLTWWYNLLYIHNFLDMRDICCSWTWYLACEMQYFLLITGLLFLYAKEPRVAKIIFGILTLSFAIIGWLCNYHNGITFQVDVIHSTLNEIYVKPWIRINPYMAGALCGWLWQQHRHHQQQKAHTNEQQQQQQQQHLHNHCHHMCRSLMPKSDAALAITTHWWRVAFWLFCIFIYLATNFMSYWRSTPTWLVASIMSFGKLLFALCVGLVIMLCACGHGGHFNALLSARPFLFLNKFCYGIYMLASVIVIALFGLRNEATNFTEVSSGMDFFAVIVMSIGAGFLLFLLVELPMQRISNVLLRKRK